MVLQIYVKIHRYIGDTLVPTMKNGYQCWSLKMVITLYLSTHAPTRTLTLYSDWYLLNTGIFQHHSVFLIVHPKRLKWTTASIHPRNPCWAPNPKPQRESQWWRRLGAPWPGENRKASQQRGPLVVWNCAQEQGLGRVGDEEGGAPCAAVDPHHFPARSPRPRFGCQSLQAWPPVVCPWPWEAIRDRRHARQVQAPLWVRTQSHCFSSPCLGFLASSAFLGPFLFFLVLRLCSAHFVGNPKFLWGVCILYLCYGYFVFWGIDSGQRRFSPGFWNFLHLEWESCDLVVRVKIALSAFLGRFSLFFSFLVFFLCSAYFVGKPKFCEGNVFVSLLWRFCGLGRWFRSETGFSWFLNYCTSRMGELWFLVKG